MSHPFAAPQCPKRPAPLRGGGGILEDTSARLGPAVELGVGAKSCTKHMTL